MITETKSGISYKENLSLSWRCSSKAVEAPDVSQLLLRLEREAGVPPADRRLRKYQLLLQ